MDRLVQLGKKSFSNLEFFLGGSVVKIKVRMSLQEINVSLCNVLQSDQCKTAKCLHEDPLDMGKAQNLVNQVGAERHADVHIQMMCFFHRFCQLRLKIYT